MPKHHSISPSSLAAAALKLPTPQGLAPSPEDCACGLCGQLLLAHKSPACPYTPALDFASDALHPCRAALICSDCTAVMAYPDALTRYSRAVFTEQGAYKLTTANDVLWLLKEAPAPLVAIYNTRKSAHMIWRTPVTHDKRVISITWGAITGIIRTSLVERAYEALRLLAKHFNANSKSSIAWPVDGLSLRDDNLHSGQLLPSHDHMLRRSDDSEIQAALNDFDALNQCERWALSAVLLTSPKSTMTWHDLNPKPPSLIAF